MSRTNIKDHESKFHQGSMLRFTAQHTSESERASNLLSKTEGLTSQTRKDPMDARGSLASCCQARFSTYYYLDYWYYLPSGNFTARDPSTFHLPPSTFHLPPSTFHLEIYLIPLPIAPKNSIPPLVGHGPQRTLH